MGRYTTQQAYSDQNTKILSNEYKEPSSSSNGSTSNTNRKLVVEKVYNVQGSCAGAGSGEFDKYRDARRRERLRIEAMEEAERKKLEEENFLQKIERNKREADERTRKNAEKRKKKKQKMLMKKKQRTLPTASHVQIDGEVSESECDDDDDESTAVEKVETMTQATVNEQSVGDTSITIEATVLKQSTNGSPHTGVIVST